MIKDVGVHMLNAVPVAPMGGPLSFGPKRLAVHMGALLLALLFPLFAVTEAQAMKIQEIKSPGGIRAWLVEEHSVPLIAVRFAFDGGNVEDPAGKEGLANFLTAMMDEGAGDLTATAFQERMEEIAAKLGFDDSRDHIYGSIETLTANRAAAIELARLAINKPRFDADAVERIRAQLQAGIVFANRDPNRVASRVWSEVAFPGHNYGRSANGTAESLAKITREDLESYRRRVFAKDTLKLVIVGDVDAKVAGEMIDQLFGDLAPKAEISSLKPVVPGPGPKLHVVDMDVPQSVAQFGAPGLARKDPDFIPAFVLNQILGGGGFASRLMEEVREKRGLAYSVYSYLQNSKQASVFAGGVATKNEDIAQSLEVIKGEFKAMAEKGPTQAELDNAKSYLTGSFALRFDTNAKIANQLLGFMVEDYGIDYVDKRNAMVAAVTLEDVKRAARRLFSSDNLVITVVGKPKNLPGRS